MIHEHLENGVEVLVMANHATHSCCLQAWVDVGSMHERLDQRGMAHFVEHMLFKGTRKLQPGQFAALVENAGGGVNAYTTFDRTVYYLNILSDHVKDGCDWLLDCVFDSQFDQLEFDREKEVILEEIRRGLDDPGQKLGQAVFTAAYRGTEVDRPIIGYHDQLKDFQRESLAEFYRTWYRPERIKVVAVGDFDEQEIYGVLRKILLQYPSSQPSPSLAGNTPQRQFPTQTEVVLLKEDFQQPKLELAFLAPSYDYHESVALDLAAYCLGSGEASRLNQVVRLDQGLVAGVGMSYYAPDFGGLLSVNAAVPLDTYRQSIGAILNVLAAAGTDEPISADELARAKANFKAEKFFRLETLEGLCQEYGFSLLTRQKTSYPEVYDALIEAATVETVNAAVRRWLTPERLIIIGMVPKEAGLTADDIKSDYGSFLASFGKQAAMRTEKAPLRSSRGPGSGFGQAADQRFLVSSENLPFQMIYRQLPTFKTFSAALIATGGQRWETAEDHGIFNAAASMVGVATKRLGQRKLAEFMDMKAAEIEGFSGKDSIGLTMSCLADQAFELLPSLREIFLEPSFPADYWENQQVQLYEVLKSQADSPSRQCVRLFLEGLFPGHPYSFNLIGSEKTITGFGAEGLLRHFSQHRDRQPWILTAVGPQSGDEALKLMQAVFQGVKLGDAGKAETVAVKAQARTEARHVFLEMNREQTHLCLGFQGLHWLDPDRAALDVLANCLGGQGGRLFMRLRERDSLAYAVSPLLSYGVEGGYFGTYIACATDKVDEAFTKMRAEMVDLTKEMISEEELVRSIQFIVGNHELDMQRGSAQVMSMAVMQLFGTGYRDFLDYMQAVKAVKREDILRVARRVIQPGDLISAIVGKRDRSIS